MPNAIDLSGRKFGRLLVLLQNGKNKQRAIEWLCLCKCGKQAVVRTDLLTSAHTQSCGCLGAERRNAAAVKALTKHGQSHTRTHNAWVSMRQRCENPNNDRYADYGGRGIYVCPRWQSFENFLADMGQCPPRMSLDRHPDNNGNYDPINCRWATNKQQCNNTRRNIVIEQVHDLLARPLDPDLLYIVIIFGPGDRSDQLGREPRSQGQLRHACQPFA